MLLPASCLLCGGRSGDGLCPDCRARFFGGGRARCRVCANPLPDAAGAMAAPDGTLAARTSMPDGIGARPLAASSGAAGPSAAPYGPSTAAVTAAVAAEVTTAASGGDGCCGRCRRQRPAYDATVTAADYALPVDRLVLQLKFGARLAHARLFGELLGVAWATSTQPDLPDLLCPVPLGPQRLAERGFNQALEIARPLGRALGGVPVRARLLRRPQDTPAQSSLEWGQRRANVAHAFTLDAGAAVYGRHVGLVDDVMSSGATLDALARECKRAGAARVSNFVFARTPPDAID